MSARRARSVSRRVVALRGPRDFVLTRQPVPGKWGVATYALKETGDERHGAIGSIGSNGHTFKAEPALRWLRGEKDFVFIEIFSFQSSSTPRRYLDLTSDQSEHLCLSKLVEMLAMSCTLKTRRDQYSQARWNAFIPKRTAFERRRSPVRGTIRPIHLIMDCAARTTKRRPHSEYQSGGRRIPRCRP